MIRILCFLLGLFGIFASCASADEISKTVDILRQQENGLAQKVTLWRPIIQVGDLLEQAAKQTGIPVYAEDSDGAAGTLVLAYFRELPLDQLMEALPSLLSEKGALWTWRTIDGPNGKRYRLIRSRQAGDMEERLRKPLREKYLAVLEKALAGRTRSDPAAALLAKTYPTALKYLGATAYETRRELVFGTENGQEFAAEGFTVSWGRWLPYFTIKEDDTEARLQVEANSELLQQLEQEVLGRWKQPGDRPLAEVTSVLSTTKDTPRTTEMDLLARVALKTGVPVLACGSLQVTRDLNPKAENWNELFSSSGYVTKSRGNVALLRHLSPNPDSQDKLKLSWSTIRTLRAKIQQERNVSDSLATLCWFLSIFPNNKSLRWYDAPHASLTPYELPASLRFTTTTIKTLGAFSTPALTPLLAACGQNPTVFNAASTEQGISSGDSTELMTTFRSFARGDSGAVFSTQSDSRAIRFRFGVKPKGGASEAPHLGMVSFPQKLEEWRVQRKTPEWQGPVRLELQLENGDWFEAAHVVVAASYLEILPPPAAP